MKKSNLLLESLVIVFGPLGVLISLVFGYEITVTVKKKEDWKKLLKLKNKNYE